MNWDIKLLGVEVGNNLKLDAHLPDIFLKVGRQVNILPLRNWQFLFTAAKSSFIVESETLTS